MKITVIGGSGLIGKKMIPILLQQGHEVFAASRATGVNTLTGEGLDDALAGRDVVVDVSNSPSFEDKAVLEFFDKSTRHLIAAAKKAGIKHVVALSVVGADRIPTSGYMRAKVAQESLLRAGGLPFTIVRATQFFEFTGGIAESGASGESIRLPHAMMQSVAADDVAATVARVALEKPRNSIVELAGPEPIPMDDLVRQFLIAKKDTRNVITDANAPYFGAIIDDRSLTPGDGPLLGKITFAEWLAES